MKAIFSRGHGLWGWVFSELGTSLFCWACSGHQLKLSYSCWKTRAVPPSEPLGGVGCVSSKQLFPEHYHKLNVFLLWLQMFNFFLNLPLPPPAPINKAKCFHVKSCDKGMLEPHLPWDCGTKYFRASSKYSVLLISTLMRELSGMIIHKSLFWFENVCFLLNLKVVCPMG